MSFVRGAVVPALGVLLSLLPFSNALAQAAVTVEGTDGKGVRIGIPKGTINVQTKNGKDVTVQSGPSGTTVKVKKPGEDTRGAATPKSGGAMAAEPERAPAGHQVQHKGNPPLPTVAADGEALPPRFDAKRLQRRSRPAMCSENQEISLVNVFLSVPEAAVVASGNCTVRISGSHISGAVAVILRDNAEVHVEGSIIEGTKVSLRVSDNAGAKVKDSVIRGAVQRSDNASLDEEGENVWK